MIIGSIARETTPEAVANWRGRRRSISASAFAAKSHLTLSQWSDKYRHLSGDLGEPGLWRTSRVPYLRAIMDAITDPRIRRVSVMKSARVGATQALVINTIGFCIHQEPSPIIVALPTVEDAQKFSDKLLRPALEDSPVLAAKVHAQKSKKRRNTMLQLSFANGGVQIIGTTSPRALRMVHGRYILKSEIDGWEGSSGDDGDPYNLIDKRAGNYGNPKFIEESTPLTAEKSRIEPAFNSGTKEYFHVPCPHCNEYQRLVWGGSEVNYGVKWKRRPSGEPDLEAIEYVCVNGCPITEVEKNRAVQRGEWVATYPERRTHRSFHLNALLSPFPGASFAMLVDEWHKTEQKPEKLRVFVNTVLGETYVEKGQQADADTLTARRDEGDIIGYEDREEKHPVRQHWYDDTGVIKVPAAAAVLTRSVDTQDDRLETAVWAWGAGEECWLIDFDVIVGDPETKEPWEALDEIRKKTYTHASGRKLLPRITFMDAGGHKTKAVNAYARKHRNEKVFSIYGATLDRAPILGNATRNNRAKVTQYPVGSFAAKEALIARLTKIVKPGPGYIHLPPWLEDEQLAQLTGEKLVVMGDRRVFKKTRSRNELLDLWVYALAALYQPKPSIVGKLGRMAKRLMVGKPAWANRAHADEPLETATDPRSRAITAPPDLLPRRRPPRRGGGGFVNGWKG